MAFDIQRFLIFINILGIFGCFDTLTSTSFLNQQIVHLITNCK